ncbi:MAG: hypothetical protein RLY78_299 [Pseudomonadota bacterium]
MVGRGDHSLNAMASMPPFAEQNVAMPADDLPDVRLLQLFDLLHETGSVTRTAELLGQSQPTVSLALGRLRRQLGDPLFVRHAGALKSTPRADALIGPCREVLAALRRLGSHAPAFEPASATLRWRICMTDASHLTLLPRLLAHLRRHAPGIRLEAAGIDAHTEQALASGEADLAIGYVPWMGQATFQQQLYTQDWVCLADAGHPRLGRPQADDGGDRLDLARYRAEGHVAIRSGTGARLLEQALTRARIERRVVLELPGFLGLGAVIQSTDLLATLPRHIGQELAGRGGLTVHACPLAIDGFPVGQHWHARLHQDPAHRWLREAVAGLFGAQGTAEGSPMPGEAALTAGGAAAGTPAE